MSDLTLLVLRVGFLLLMWLFIFAVVYALKSDLFGAPVRKLSAQKPDVQPLPIAAPVVLAAPSLAQPQAEPAPLLAPTPTPAFTAAPARTLAITSGVAAGTTIPLEDEYITIGRSSDSTLVIVDEYTSTYHARLHRAGMDWILTDLDSTNGTMLAGERVTVPVAVPLETPITIGTTTFELRA